jgi:hypothetical protein
MGDLAVEVLGARTGFDESGGSLTSQPFFCFSSSHRAYNVPIVEHTCTSCLVPTFCTFRAWHEWDVAHSRDPSPSVPYPGQHDAVTKAGHSFHKKTGTSSHHSLTAQIFDIAARFFHSLSSGALDSPNVGQRLSMLHYWRLINYDACPYLTGFSLSYFKNRRRQNETGTQGRSFILEVSSCYQPAVLHEARAGLK